MLYNIRFFLAVCLLMLNFVVLKEGRLGRCPNQRQERTLLHVGQA